MISVESKGSELYINGEKVRSFSHSIVDSIVTKDKVLILLDYKESINENLYCLDFFGKLLWQVSSYPDYENEECPITDIKIVEHELIVFRWCSHTEKINFDTGEILESIFIQ